MPKKLFVLINIIILTAFTQVLKAQVKHPADTTQDDTEEPELIEEDESYDSLITDPDEPYWELVRPRDFTFDTTFAPARSLYSVWDTITVNPYKNDLRN